MKMLAISYLPAFEFNAPFAGLTIKRIQTAFDVARERRALRELSTEQLVDMGIDPAVAAEEANRSFWDIPAGR